MRRDLCKMAATLIDRVANLVMDASTKLEKVGDAIWRLNARVMDLPDPQLEQEEIS